MVGLNRPERRRGTFCGTWCGSLASGWNVQAASQRFIVVQVSTTPVCCNQVTRYTHAGVMEVKPLSNPTRSEVVERRLGVSCRTMSLLCQSGVPVITDVVLSGHTGVCRLVCVLWDQVGHPCQAMREPGQVMNTEEEELDLFVGYSTPLSVHSVDSRWDSVYC